MPQLVCLLKRSCCCIFILLASCAANDRSEIPFLKAQAMILAAPDMHGRGYVNGGGDKAARYISDQFRQFGLKAFDSTKDYYQPYTFSVNTFPGIVSLQLDNKILQPGKDFLVHAASSAVAITNKKLITIDLAGVKDSIAWQVMQQRFNYKDAYLIRNIDTLIKYNKLTFRSLAQVFDRGIYIIPLSRKLNWLATTDTVPSAIFFVKDSAMPVNVKKVSAIVQTKFIPAFSTQNILGFVPGTQQPDSFIVFSAHYDHLGEMGRGTVFPGASDNASGVAVLLSLARYYAAHPARYSVAFMAFSGEEAGMIGSGHYVMNPVFPLQQIRFMVNLDITGDATGGITVVNALERKKEYALLEQINQKNDYLPSLTARGQAKNSDHYQFSEKGVPAVYIYTNGVKPYYHDLQDRPEELGFEKADGLLALLKEFVRRL